MSRLCGGIASTGNSIASLFSLFERNWPIPGIPKKMRISVVAAQLPFAGRL
jgi:hypothetical protein